MPETSDDQKIFKVSEIPRVRSDRFVSAYANHIEATPGFYELGLLFYQIAKGPDGKPLFEQSACITLSWEHALRVRDMLDRVVKTYQKEHGEIRLLKEPVPPDDK